MPLIYEADRDSSFISQNNIYQLNKFVIYFYNKQLKFGYIRFKASELYISKNVSIS